MAGSMPAPSSPPAPPVFRQPLPPALRRATAIPTGSHALGADGQIVAIRGDEFEKVGEVVVANVGVDQFFAGAVHDADIHLAGMEINSAVEFSGGGVILHSNHSLWGRETPVSYVWLCGEVLVTLPRPVLCYQKTHRA
jgi:hypothetical protein